MGALRQSISSPPASCWSSRVGGWRAYEWWEAKKAAEAGAAFEAAVALSDQGKHKEAEEAFAKLAADGTASYRMLAKFREAAELARRDPKAAVAIYDQLAADGSLGPVLQDLAALRAGMILVDTAPYDEIMQRLEPLTAPDRDVPPQRPRHAGARGLARQGHDRDAALVRHDPGRCRDAGRHPRPDPDAAGARRMPTRRAEASDAPPPDRPDCIAARARADARRAAKASIRPDWFNTKKPLPGERKAVFPGGVPGVPQGVPPELVRGLSAAARAAAAAGRPSEKPKPKPKPKPRPQQAARATRRRRAAAAAAGRQRQPIGRRRAAAAAAAAASWPAPSAIAVGDSAATGRSAFPSRRTQCAV